MNSWLASVYGTGASQDNDIEKVAQSMLLQKMAEAEGISLEGLSPEQIEELAAEVIPQETAVDPAQAAAGGQPGMVAQAGEGASEEEAGEGETEELSKEASAKFEEADFLGRVMAHSFVQESEKIAAAKTAGAGDMARRFGGAAKEMAGKARGALKTKAHSAVEAGKAHVGAHKKKYLGGAAAAGAAGAFGAGRMSKEASPILQKLAEIRAAEILAENGIDPATGLAAAPAGGAQQAAEPVAPEQQVQQAVEQKAVEILKEAGYKFA